MPPGRSASAPRARISPWSSARRVGVAGVLAPARVGPRGERSQVRAGRIHEDAIVARTQVASRRRVRLHQFDDRGAEACGELGAPRRPLGAAARPSGSRPRFAMRAAIWRRLHARARRRGRGRARRRRGPSSADRGGRRARLGDGAAGLDRGDPRLPERSGDDDRLAHVERRRARRRNAPPRHPRRSSASSSSRLDAQLVGAQRRLGGPVPGRHQRDAPARRRAPPTTARPATAGRSGAPPQRQGSASARRRAAACPSRVARRRTALTRPAPRRPARRRLRELDRLVDGGVIGGLGEEQLVEAQPQRREDRVVELLGRRVARGSRSGSRSCRAAAPPRRRAAGPCPARAR